MKKHTISLRNAVNGLIWSIKTQPNFRVHFIVSLFTLIGGYLFKVSYNELLIILTLIITGLIIESVNTAIEATTDAIDDKWREDIKRAKDVAASAMLIFSAGALLIACVIFIPKILNFIKFI